MNQSYIMHVLSHCLFYFRTHIMGSIITSSNFSDYYSKNLKSNFPKI